jgi:hypothetical protein
VEESAGLAWAWHWVFPAPKLWIEPRTGVERRHQLNEKRLSRQLKQACSQEALPSP